MLAGLDRTLALRRLRLRDAASDAARLPNPVLPPGTDTLPEIRHIVLLMMENHSFDNYFGTLGHGDGMPMGGLGFPSPSNLDSAGKEVRAHWLDSTVQLSGVPSQSWNASHIQWDNGANDGFVRSIEQTVPGKDPTVAMGYWREEDLPFYAGLARIFPLADRWFCSLLGPTFPNRRFLMAATANGLIDDIPTGMIDYPSTGTIFDLLDRNGISWVNYHHAKSVGALLKRLLGSVGLRTARGIGLLLSGGFPSLLKTVQGNIQFTADIYPVGLLRFLRHLRSIDRFWIDAAKGTLPSVCIVDPDFQACSEENPQDVQVGEGFAAKVIEAVMHGKGWPATLLIWFYDEHGGYYDHVPPPAAVEPDDVGPRSLLTAGSPIRWLLHAVGLSKQIEQIDTGDGRYDHYGFRVPAVVVSPYAKPGGFVSSQCYDHTSVLKLIERKWNLPPLTRRDAAAKDPLDMLDLHSPPAFLTPPDLPPPAISWPPAAPPVSRRVRVAQAIGLVGRGTAPVMRQATSR